ncbi:undecaprenyl/decaprenyl-phosphate alpha-N-acetylglucosaminyl 1-phosphate transferase [Actinobacteria bacterium YIM 96077]|uniref:Undecaprenyl/decaprenyl-phosphate alpha-N-acetylglucosaminyl 1-phosphate transferase n=1 Tax=Phytoactinopolyspora halophila TaxID=1981511 RepID=A0A329QR47_9ACTN|nr:MraY family glycosyltransferase [Phytoactinopolyspora halophila]AYY14278.1 undecaprenyl/decaprenyl-phosphate alpha-N-acetylglucosaminyl 1-phosphate transferase [Actinobacteria bacterium YIM 96077]RAW14820.1 undecaprenyl/decaprenyl-phosphate alpha-N-acetylglucosaminyl 1-phosphate transferase [Phytoactinopolyspora halophila]
MREYLLTFFVAASITYLMVGLCGRIAHWVGAVPPTRDRDVHHDPIPRLGGLAMLAGVLGAMLVASYLPRMRAVFAESTDAQALITAVIVICVLGAADDIWDLSALAKFAGQLLAAGLLVVQGVELLWLPLPNGVFTLDPAQRAILTVILVVGAINAVNFVDGLDGLAAGVVGIGAAAFFSYAYLLAVEGGETRMTTPALTAVVLMGVCAGFLPYNIHPARVFMGDSGAMLLGLLLAAGSITLTGRSASQDVEESSFLLTLLPLVLPAAVIALPFLDMLMAVVRRTRAGRSPFAPDKQHLHHRLLQVGHSVRRAVMIMWVWAALVSGGVVTIALVGGWTTYALLGIAILALLAFTMRRPRRLLQRTPASAGADGDA